MSSGNSFSQHCENKVLDASWYFSGILGLYQLVQEELQTSIRALVAVLSPNIKNPIAL